MSAARLAKTAIKIPMRIERGPTDILKALASTVKYLPKTPNAALADDPYLLPSRLNDANNYILAKLSGKRTAKFIFRKYPELFYRDMSEPKVDDFTAPEKFEPEMEFTDEDVKWCIENRDTENALIAYHAMTEKGIELQKEVLLQLFEMICYSNEEKLLDDYENQISRFFIDPERQLVDRTWKTNGVASKIFNRIKEEIDPPRVYSAMIAGLSKFNEHNTALQVFEDFKSNHPSSGLYQSAYDGLIRSISKLQGSSESANKALQDIVGHMETNLVAPNLEIFNSILKVYRSFNCGEKTCENSFKLINDMGTLGIRPSLATYSFLLGILVKHKGGRSHIPIINAIIDDVAKCELEIRDDRDTEFFLSAMSLACNNLNNLKLAQKIHRTYLKNPSLFENEKRRSSYFNTYFRLIITTDTLENIMSFYNTYVPNNLRVSSDNYDALAEALDLYQADADTINKIGDDIVMNGLYKHMKNDKLFRKNEQYVKAIEDKETKRNSR